MGFVEVMREREMLAQVTHEEELIEHLAASPRVAYAGFDPTAESLHVGHLLPVMALRRWQQAGHKVIALVGGGTALVGDPTGKSEMRQMLSAEDIDKRIEKFRSQLSAFLDLDDPNRGEIVNNADWLRPLQYLPFLREFGSQFSVNRMLAAECFKQRLEKGLSFLEFNYMILQSYDFYYLWKEFGCSVQLGGDDQWSNMLGGMDLVRRKDAAQAYCLTVPLLVNSQGKKMGKTEKGAVWIDPNLTSPYELFQYFRNIDDDMVRTCLLYFTDFAVNDINDMTAHRDHRINDAKVELAYAFTKLLHGEEEANKAKEQAAKLFSKADSGNREDAPRLELPPEIWAAELSEMSIVDVLAATDVFKSKSEVRKLIQQGGLTVEGEKISDINHKVSKTELFAPQGLFIRRGKKLYYQVVIAPSSS